MANNFKTTIELSAQSPSGNLLYTTLELPATRGEITDAAHRLRNLPSAKSSSPNLTRSPNWLTRDLTLYCKKQ